MADLIEQPSDSWIWISICISIKPFLCRFCEELGHCHNNYPPFPSPLPPIPAIQITKIRCWAPTDTSTLALQKSHGEGGDRRVLCLEADCPTAKDDAGGKDLTIQEKFYLQAMCPRYRGACSCVCKCSSEDMDVDMHGLTIARGLRISVCWYSMYVCIYLWLGFVHDVCMSLSNCNNNDNNQ